MTIIFLIFLLTAAVVFIFWYLLKSKKKRLGKKVKRKKKPVLKNKTYSKKQESIDSISDQIRRKKADQMKKNPEIISQVVRIWLNEK